MADSENSGVESFSRLRDLRVTGDQVLPVKASPSFVPGSAAVNGNSLNIRAQDGSVISIVGGGGSADLYQVTHNGNTTDQQMIINRTGSTLTLDSTSISSSTGLAIFSNTGTVQLRSAQSDIFIIPRSSIGTGPGSVNIQGKNGEGGILYLADALILSSSSAGFTPTIGTTSGVLLSPAPALDINSSVMLGGVTFTTSAASTPFSVEIILPFASASAGTLVQVTARNTVSVNIGVGAVTNSGTSFSIIGTSVAGGELISVAYFVASI